MKNFSNRISELRKSKGLTQKQMAEELAMTQVGYSKIETGKTELTIQKLSRIARILEVDLITLLWPDANLSSDYKKLKEDYSRLNKINDLLVDLVESKNNLLGIILQSHPETKQLIEAHKSYEELEALGLRKNIRERLEGL